MERRNFFAWGAERAGPKKQLTQSPSSMQKPPQKTNTLPPPTPSTSDLEYSKKAFRSYLAKIYVCSTLLFLIIVVQWTTLLIYFKEMTGFLDSLIVYQIVAIFIGFYCLLGLLTFTRRFQRSPVVFLWAYVFVTIELNSVTLAKTLRYFVVPNYYYMLGMFFCFYLLSVILSSCGGSKFATHLCVHDTAFATSAPMRVHIVSTMLGLCSSKHIDYLNLAISIVMVLVNFMNHLMFSASIGNPKLFVNEKNGHLLLTVLNTIGFWSFYTTVCWFLQELVEMRT